MTSGRKGADIENLDDMAAMFEQSLFPEQASDPTQAIEAILQKAQQVAGDPHRFTIYENNPGGFVKDILGINLWDKQVEILKMTISNNRVAVRSGHGVGKTFVVACLVLWWMYARKGLVVTTAPTWNHVEGVLWREINSIASRALVPLPGTAFQTERRIANDWYAIGLSTNTPHAFQGIHHPRLLVVLDEAPGVSEQVHLEVSTLATGERNCILMIGNPTDLSGTFYNAFKHPEVWAPLHISCLDHPNVVGGIEVIAGAVTRTWVEIKRAEWGTAHPFWASRVLGEFPEVSMRGVIPPFMAHRAMNNDAQRVTAASTAQWNGLPIIIGVDVARYGDNKCVMITRRGDAVLSIESWHHASTMETTGRVVEANKKLVPQRLYVDESGLGAGVVDRLLELGLPVTGFNGGHRAFTPGQFANRRSELWWHLRSRLEHERLWMPDHPILYSELIAPEYELTSSGRLRVESKEALLRRGVASPDHADALVMAFADEGSHEEFLVGDALSGGGQDPDASWFINNSDEQADYPQLPVGW